MAPNAALRAIVGPLAADVAQNPRAVRLKPRMAAGYHRGRVQQRRLDEDHRTHTPLSLFGPEQAARSLRAWAPPGGLVLVPFGSMGVIGVVANLMEFPSISVDCVPRYVEAMEERFARRPRPEVRCDAVLGDARKLSFLREGEVDFILTSPPYWNREQYVGAPAQLAAIKSYDAFLAELGKAVAECYRVLRPGAYCRFSVDVEQLGAEVGFALHDLVVVRLTGARHQMAHFSHFGQNRQMVRVHEFEIVWRKPVGKSGKGA